MATESSERKGDVHSDFKVQRQELTICGLSDDISLKTPVTRYNTVGNTFTLPEVKITWFID